MSLITEAIEKRLLANGLLSSYGVDVNEHQPVVKLFAPWTNMTWLLTDVNPNNFNYAFGLCDTGHDLPELGYVDLEKLQALEGPAGLKVKRDDHFVPDHTLGEYVKLARREGRIIV